MNLKKCLPMLALAGVLLSNAAAADDSKPLALVPRPAHVFKTRDPGHERTESWVFWLMIQTTEAAKLTATSMKISLLRNSEVQNTSSFSAKGLEGRVYEIGVPPKLSDGSPSPTPIFWPAAIRIRQTEPAVLGVDAMRVDVEARDEFGHIRVGSAVVPIETYTQKSALIFPFRGKGVILQGGATNGGHPNRSGEFAIDAFGLDDSWSITAPGDGKLNSDYRGWGRDLIAPAGGTVVRVRNDRPDQPVADESDPKFYAPEYSHGGDPGNYVVIDHGGSEYSMIAHFQAGSMLVKVGDKVHQGQTLGKLGHSGDTTGPHCHYQLQSGPDWENADALPVKFTNVDQQHLDRGTYFEAK